MLSKLNLKFKRKLTAKGKDVALLGYRVLDLYYKKKKVFINFY